MGYFSTGYERVLSLYFITTLQGYSSKKKDLEGRHLKIDMLSRCSQVVRGELCYNRMYEDSQVTMHQHFS